MRAAAVAAASSWHSTGLHYHAIERFINKVNDTFAGSIPGVKAWSARRCPQSWPYQPALHLQNPDKHSPRAEHCNTKLSLD